MEDQVTPSTSPQPPASLPPEIDPQIIAMMKARAKEEAIRMTMAQRVETGEQPPNYPAVLPIPQPTFNRPPAPQIIYLRRNLTVAELLLVIALACGIVTGVQQAWNFATDLLPRIEIKTK